MSLIRSRFRPFASVFLSLTLLGMFTSLLYAQQNYGTILGTVRDQTGAVVAGAKVTVTNVATQLTNQTTTDREGLYQVLALPIGNYTVAVERSGFKKEVTTARALEINQNLRVDIGLQIGSNTDIVTVESTSAGVETVNPTLGQSITNRPIVNLPLNGRNVLQLAMLQPGVTETNTFTNGTSNGQAGQFSISGSKSDSVTFLLDGGLNNNLLSNGVVYNPNPDTIAEFRLLTSNYSAEYGRNAGGVVSVVTKSGTNMIHGSAYDFVRNDAFNATAFFNKRNGVPKDILKRNQFGGTVGGPIMLPHVSGKDRFFWFFGYQGQRQVQQVPQISSTFTPTELTGDFSHSGGNGTADPGVVAFLASHPFFQPNAALAAQGIIDPSKIDPVAKAYIKNNLIPTSPLGKLASQGRGVNNNNDVTMKFDFLVTQNDRLGVTLGGIRNPNLTPFSGGANVPGYGINGQNNRYYSNISYTKTFSATLLNEFRFTAQRQNVLQASPEAKLPTASQLGIGITPDQPTGPPRLGFDSGLTIGFSPQGPTHLVDDTFVWADTVTWVKGKHTWKFGGSYSPYDNNTLYDFYINGEFDFGNGSNSIGTKNSYADFLLGLPFAFTQFPTAPSNIRSKTTNVFAQDEWHILKNLTLNLGLRYEYNSPKLDTQGRSYSLKLGQQSQVFTNAPLGLLFPGDPGTPKGANFPDKNDFAPRFGFAWDPTGNGKMSVRGGAGVFYDILKGEDNLQFNGQAPFFGAANLNWDPVAGSIAGQTNYLTQPFVTNNSGTPNPFPSKPPTKNLDFTDFLPFGGGGVYFVDEHLRTPYTYQYNLSVQRELPSSMVGEIAYVGSSTHKQTGLIDSNPFVLGTTKRLFNSQPSTTNSTFSYLDTFVNVADANYNSLQSSLQKRLSTDNRFFGGSYFTLAYTWAKSIDTASGFRNNGSRVPYYDHQAFRAVSDYDITHRVTFSGGWDLPFNQFWQSGPSRLIKGWSVYPIVTWRTGFPIDLRGFLSRSRTRPGPSGAGDANQVHPNLIGSFVTTFDPHQVQTLVNPLTGKPNSGSFYFDPTDFEVASLSALNSSGAAATNPALRTYGTLPRNFFRGPSRINTDFTLAKVTPILGENRLNAEFRADFFNIFNHAEFDLPTTSFTNAQFGQVTTTADPRIIQLALRLVF